MSLSQKHSGKVLAPWFNISEWKLVYNLIYSGTAQDWPRALSILKIWKHRTPLLSAGVEGTLIILEALLVNTTPLSPYETSHIFSTSIVRFLNLCAANSDRQGSFYKTAMKNELPKWLVSIRHDIAHSHKVPSRSMLELSLKFCLEWLKGKYWDAQDENMMDFVVHKSSNSVVEDVVFIYDDLNEGEIVWSKRKLVRRINNFIEVGDAQVGSKEIMQTINDMLREELKINKEESTEKICTLLVDNLIILSIECELNESGKTEIPREFLKKWSGFLNIIHEAEILPKFVLHLFHFTCDQSHDSSHKEVASLWIKEIFYYLISKENNSKNQGLFFRSNTECMKNKNFVAQILQKANSFTLNFVKELLEYNDASADFIGDSVALISAALNPPTVFKNDRIFTMDDLNMDEEDDVGNLLNKEEPRMQLKSRWILIEDTSPYMNLPLGILPHQDPSTNPLLSA